MKKNKNSIAYFEPLTIDSDVETCKPFKYNANFHSYGIVEGLEEINWRGLLFVVFPTINTDIFICKSPF